MSAVVDSLLLVCPAQVGMGTKQRQSWGSWRWGRKPAIKADDCPFVLLVRKTLPRSVGGANWGEYKFNWNWQNRGIYSKWEIEGSLHGCGTSSRVFWITEISAKSQKAKGLEGILRNYQHKFLTPILIHQRIWPHAKAPSENVGL